MIKIMTKMFLLLTLRAYITYNGFENILPEDSTLISIGRH